MAASEKVGSFLDKPAVPPPTTAGTATYEPIVERPGTVIGPYKLLEQIGEGGMGLVFVAEQQHPIRRKVALKIIKPGMDSGRSSPASRPNARPWRMMDHQNIAKVYDAGTTDSGRPLLRDGAGSRRPHHRVLRRPSSSPRASGWSCSSPSARPFSTPTRRGSSTATSSRPTCW